jgi:hypothetical protein
LLQIVLNPVGETLNFHSSSSFTMSDAPPPPPANLPPNPELEASIKFQLEHWNDDRRPAIITSGWVLYILAVVAVILRFYAKRLIRNSFKAEDGLILAALVRSRAKEKDS